MAKMELGLGFEEAFRNSVSVADNLPPEQLTLESADLLEDGISRIISDWPILRRMVAREIGNSPTKNRKEYRINSSSTGGRLKSKKLDQIQSEIFNWFTQSKVPLETDALRLLIFRTVLRSYMLQLGDGSPLKVACKLMDLYQQCLQKSASRRGGEEATLKGRRPGQGRRAYGARQAPY